MVDTRIPAEEHDLSAVPNVDRDLLLEKLPQFVQTEGPVTVKDCVEELALPDSEPPSEDTLITASVMASDTVRKGLDWLVEQGYLNKTQNEKGHLLYY